MKTLNYLLIAAAILTLSAFTLSNSINWKVSDKYSIKFSGTKVEGIFKDLTGNVQFDEKDIENSNFSFNIAVNSINTGNGMKNIHAVSDKWFDAEKYPSISFKSSKVKKTSTNFEVTGNMTIHGVTKEMTIPFTFNNSTFLTKFSINRMDFKVGTMTGMSKKVSDKIDLEVSIPVIK